MLRTCRIKDQVLGTECLEGKKSGLPSAVSSGAQEPTVVNKKGWRSPRWHAGSPKFLPGLGNGDQNPQPISCVYV